MERLNFKRIAIAYLLILAPFLVQDMYAQRDKESKRKRDSWYETYVDSLFNIYERTLKETPLLVPKALEVDEKEMTDMLDLQPSFAIYQDTYFVTGIPMNKRIDTNSADAMFQVSVRQRLTRSRLPFNTFAYLTYTQKSFWGIYAQSSPFRDNNYNPGIGLGKYIFKDNKLKGTLFVQFEHESNGQDSIDSRSWNRISFSWKYFYNPRLTFTLKAWIPFVDGSHNKNLLKYRGLGTLTLNHLSRNGKWWFSAEVTPRNEVVNMNALLTASYQISKRQNQHIYVRFYSGRGESLLDYKRYTMNIRVGFCFRPDFFGVY